MVELGEKVERLSWGVLVREEDEHMMELGG